MDKAVLVAVAALVLSLLGGLNQIWEFFSPITRATVFLSVVLSFLIVLFLPHLLESSDIGQKRIVGLSSHNLAFVVAAIVLLFGTAPYGYKWWHTARLAKQANQFFDDGLHAKAKAFLPQVASSYEAMGFSDNALVAKVMLAQVEASLGNFTEAQSLLQGLDEADHGGALLQAKIDLAKGNVAHRQGQWVQAEGLYQQALQNVEDGSHTQAVAWQNLAAIWIETRQKPDGIIEARLLKTRALYQNLNDYKGEVQTLINLGTFFSHDPPKALTYFQQAAQLLGDTPDPLTKGTVQFNIALMQRFQGGWERARRTYQQALTLFEQGADPLAQAEVELNLAALELGRGATGIARTHLQRARGLLTPGEETASVARARIVTMEADIHDAMGDSALAIARYQEALEILQSNPHPHLHAKTLVGYATVLHRQGKLQEAKIYRGQAREMLEAGDSSRAEHLLAVLMNNRGMWLQQLGNYEGARVLFEEALAYFKAQEDAYYYAQAMENLGNVQGFAGEHAPELLREALEIFREKKDYSMVVKTLFNLYSTPTAPPSSPEQPDHILQEIFSILEHHNLDQQTEAYVLSGILIQDVHDEQQLMYIQERLLALEQFQKERHDRQGLGRTYLQLASIQQRRRNLSGMRMYARQAEPYVEAIPLPARITALMNLGFYLSGEDEYEKSIGYFWKSFDHAVAVNVDMAKNILVPLGLKLEEFRDLIDPTEHRPKVEYVLEHYHHPEIQDQAQAMLKTLQS